MFTATLFIGIGSKNCYFTLRERYEHVSYGRDANGFCGTVNGVFVGTKEVEVRSFHHFNLSQNADEAFEKATTFANANGIRLTTTLESLDTELDEIKRLTAAEQAAKIAKQEAQCAAWAEELTKVQAEKYALLDSGVYPFGQYYNKPLREAPISYINWLVSSIDTFEPQTLIHDVAVAVKAVCTDLILPTPNNEYVGEEKQRLTFDAVVVRRAGYEGAFGYVSIVTFVTDAGVCLVSKSTSFSASVGDKLKFKATIKGHDAYKGQSQTLIQRIAVI